MIAVLSLFQIISCNHQQYALEKEDPQLPCKVRGACDATVIHYTKKLTREGVTVITMGQDYLVSIPASALFENETAHLTWASYGVLNDTAILLKQFRKIAINITSYSAPYVSVQRDRALTLARSRVVSDYLWSQGVDSRLIFVQGLGSDKPISRIKGHQDSSINARVEITFRDTVA